MEGKAGHGVSDAAYDLGFSLTGSPGGFFPVAHLGNGEHRDGHGAKLHRKEALTNGKTHGFEEDWP
jgi:hypothetical protein